MTPAAQPATAKNVGQHIIQEE
jgi:hypothetical protein